jgi:hypothetical protein
MLALRARLLPPCERLALLETEPSFDGNSSRLVWCKICRSPYECMCGFYLLHQHDVQGTRSVDNIASRRVRGLWRFVLQVDGHSCLALFFPISICYPLRARRRLLMLFRPALVSVNHVDSRMKRYLPTKAQSLRRNSEVWNPQSEWPCCDFLQFYPATSEGQIAVDVKKSAARQDQASGKNCGRGNLTVK